MLAPTQMYWGNHHYTYIILLAVSWFFKQIPKELMDHLDLVGTQPGGPDLSLNSRELALLGDLIHDTIFNYLCKMLWSSCEMLFTWLLMVWHQLGTLAALCSH